MMHKIFKKSRAGGMKNLYIVVFLSAMFLCMPMSSAFSEVGEKDNKEKDPSALNTSTFGQGFVEGSWNLNNEEIVGECSGTYQHFNSYGFFVGELEFEDGELFAWIKGMYIDEGLFYRIIGILMKPREPRESINGVLKADAVQFTAYIDTIDGLLTIEGLQ